MSKTTNLGLYLSAGQKPDSYNRWPGHIDENFATIDAAIAALQAAPAVPSFADAEVPSGLVNGSNTAFTLAHAPNPASSLLLFKNGVLQKKSGADFTLTGAAITFTTAPQTGDTLEAFYRF